jgi:invasion protein IalB
VVLICVVRIFLALATSVIFAVPAIANSAVYQDWSVDCRDDLCLIEQTVLASDRTWLATARVQKTQNDSLQMQILVPAGVHLASGIFVDIPGRDVRQALFLRCSSDACEAQLALDAAEARALRNGTAARLRYRPRVSSPPVSFPVSLMGITAALRDVPLQRP